MSNRKVTLIGGGGVRTPLVIFGVNESSKHLGVDEMVLYDTDADRAHVMCELGKALIAREGGTLKLRVSTDLEDAIEGASFVLTAIRVGGIKARAIDERISIDNGYPGQETTGPGGVFVLSRDGKPLGRINTGQPTANCAWGGDGSTFYITANMFLIRVQTLTKGAGW